MSLSDIRSFVSSGYANSVVRRSILLLCLMGPAFAINLVLYYVAASLLSPENFGLFYIAVTAANVLYSGSTVLNIFFTRYLVSVIQAAGDSAAYSARSRIQRLIVRVGVLPAGACILALFGFGKLVGVESPLIIVLIVLDAFTAYLVDIDRALLQGLRKTVLLGSVTLVWMALRFVLSAAGMALFKTAWAGLLGAVLATLLVVAGLSMTFFSSDRLATQRFQALPPVRTLLPVILGYGSLILVSNLDVLLTYLLLKNAALGAYSASSVFPKGILVVVTPLLQMLYPMMVGQKKAGLRDNRIVLLKCLGVILALSGTTALAVFLFRGLLCGGAWGLKLCQPYALQLLLLSAVFLSLLRVIAFYQSARASDWTAISMLVPAAAYLWIAESSARAPDTIAAQFTVFSAVVLIFYAAVSLISERWFAYLRLG